MTHEEVDGSRIGQHPLVTRFLKGVFNSRPPVPKYSSTWDVDKVLVYIRNLPPNEELSLTLLSHKLVMLMALANADRCSDLAALDLDYRTFQQNGVKFVIPKLTKTRRLGPPMEAFYSSFPSEAKLCPVTTLRCYEEKTTSLRKRTKSNGLFISVRKPHKPVTSATIGHWMKKVMTSAGIDTSIFSAHSTRGASTSKAKQMGTSISDILKAANWTSEATFGRFYNRPIRGDAFGRQVLQIRQHPESW